MVNFPGVWYWKVNPYIFPSWTGHLQITNASVSWRSSTFNVLILMLVMVPSVLNFLANSLLRKVSWLQQYNMVYAFSPFLELLHIVLGGATHMLTIFDLLISCVCQGTIILPRNIPITCSIFLADFVAMWTSRMSFTLLVQISQTRLCLQVHELCSDHIGV